MKLSIHAGDYAALDVDLLAIPVFEGAEALPPSAHALDEALGGSLLGMAKEEGFKGRADQSFATHSHGRLRARKVALFGLGKEAKADAGALREFAVRVLRAGSRAKRIAIVAPDAGALVTPEAIERTAESLAAGAALGTYKFDRYKTGESEKSSLRDVILAFAEVGDTPTRMLAVAATRGEAIANAVKLARDLVNEPPITLTPSAFAEHARRVAREGKLKVSILGPKEMKKHRMGMLLGVAQGSAEEPRLIHLTYTPAKVTKKTPKVALVGKGLTFDSGGLSLKPPKSMEDMKCDMAGGAAVLATMRVVSALRPNVIVHGFIGAVENMPDGHAIRPGDILKSMNGKTVEVLNTDAEGRLVLGDVITYARTFKVDELIDLATLTGACMVALGRGTAGYFSNDETLAARFDAAARRAGEDVWRLPLTEKMVELLRSPVADLRNIGDAYGGAITGALFLREFVGDTAWVHVDIAGPAFVEGKGPAAGGTGFWVLSLVEYLAARA